MTHCVLGIDPGLAHTGWGLIKSDGIRHAHLAHGSIKTPAAMPFHERLLTIHQNLSQLIEEYRPVGAGMETLYFSKNVSSGIPVAQARGVAVLAIAQRSMAFQEFSPTAIKQSVVGSGGADKTQVQHMVRLLLGLPDIPKPDHAADALAAAITFVHHGSLWSTASVVQ
ncbi:MAG: crossover junction endodeoxyribonuclease RuvC [Spirochaetales bacterium]|nr:crossover junction endodeoxyribonuclease RuvC [Spirochaetales bacterium]